MRKIYQFTPEGMTELDEWPMPYDLPLGTYLYEPADPITPWVRTGKSSFGLPRLGEVPKEYRMIALLLG